MTSHEIDKTTDDGVLDAVIESSAAFQRLTIAPEWRPSVRTHLSVIAAAAHLVTTLTLDDEIEAAPVFTP